MVYQFHGRLHEHLVSTETCPVFDQTVTILTASPSSFSAICKQYLDAMASLRAVVAVCPSGPCTYLAASFFGTLSFLFQFYEVNNNMYQSDTDTTSVLLATEGARAAQLAMATTPPTIETLAAWTDTRANAPSLSLHAAVSLSGPVRTSIAESSNMEPAGSGRVG